jgi:hypothetical protein
MSINVADFGQFAIGQPCPALSAVSGVVGAPVGARVHALVRSHVALDGYLTGFEPGK